MPLYKTLINKMLEEHKNLFEEFESTYNKYGAGSKEFNTKGDQVMEQVRLYINILCGASEGSGFGNYSQNLSDKFMGALRERYPYIDEIGIQN